ncbi:uncharacterized protein LOC134811146 [Bolinopsis microptera]|uniref:uncharacterized protein LOC134811146 n=1 Tax=Bolinopsis microptera TaxID=2820187 RepID=UPI00307AED8E
MTHYVNRSLSLFLLVLAFEGGFCLNKETCGTVTEGAVKKDAECVKVDFYHTHLETLTCKNTTSTELCWRPCDNASYLTDKYITFSNILSPTYNKTKLSYDLKKLNIIYSMGESFMFALQKTSLFDLMEKIITEKWFEDGYTQGRILQVVEAELPWFIVIGFLLFLVIGLTLFVTFSMLDGLFGWTDGTKRQKMDPSNGTWVNFYGFLIIIFTIMVLCSCLLCFVGNVLVTENKGQAALQLQLDYNWSMAYEEQGAQQLSEFIYEFNDQLLPKLVEWYNEAIPTAVSRIQAVTTADLAILHTEVATLNTHLNGARKISELITTVQEMMNLASYVSSNISSVNCTKMIPTLADAYCKATDFTDAANDECWTQKDAEDFSKPTNTMIDDSWPVVTTLIEEKLIEAMTNSSKIIVAAWDAKIYDDFLKGEARWNKLKTTLEERTATYRAAFALQVAQAKIMASSQMESFITQQKVGFKDFTQAIQFPNYFFGETSLLSDVNQVRYFAFIVVNALSLATVFVGVFAWCVGCCNFKADQRPTSRGAKSHYPGMIIYFSSYAALFLSLFCIMTGVIYFIPTSLFAFSCDVYKKADEAMHRTVVQEDDQNFFVFWDKHLVVDYNILALYTHGQKNFNLTFNQFFRACLRDDALFDALKLAEIWPTIPDILAVNETLDTVFHVNQLKLAKFDDQILMEKEKATLCQTLHQTLEVLQFTNLEATFKKGKTTLFNDTQANVEAWQANIENWNKKMKKKLKKEDDYKAFKEHCLEKWVTNEDIIKDMGEWQEEQEEAAKKATSKRRRKRFNWDDFDSGGGDDDDGGGSNTDYSKLGIGALSKKFNTLMASYDALYTQLNIDILTSKIHSLNAYSKWSVLQPFYLETRGPTILLSTIIEYGNIILTEIDCFVITASKQIEHQMGQCRTIYDVLDGTMTYFCNFLVGPMTITWISFLLGGIALSLYIQAARAVSMYFLRMDAVHPGDISQEEKVAAMKGDG